MKIPQRNIKESKHCGRELQVSSENVAKALLNIGAVKIQPDDPFTWASGIISPIYCDNRQIIGNVDARKDIVKYFVEKIKEIGRASCRERVKIAECGHALKREVD